MLRTDRVGFRENAPQAQLPEGQLPYEAKKCREVRAISSAARGIEKERHLRSFVLPGDVHQPPVPYMKLPVEIADQHLRWLRVRCYRPDMCGKVALLLLSCNGARLSQ